MLILIGGGAWWFLNANRPAAVASKAPAEAARLSIVVLPFTNLSNDPAQDYFADGVTENLTTELSRLHNSFVIARNTAFTFKGKNLDAKAIGKELGVRYVLEGSVQRDANRVRVNAQLIDAESGAHLWADRFEDDVVDLFKLQDEVVARLARTLQVELVNAEAQRSLHDRPRNPDAIDLTMRGFALLNQPSRKPIVYEARDLFEQALTLDPTNADALAGAALSIERTMLYGWSDQSVDLYARAMQRANQALLLNPDQATAHYAKAHLIMFKTKPNDAASANEIIAEAEATLRADPSFATAYLPMAVAEVLLGRYEQVDIGSRTGHADQSTRFKSRTLAHGNGQSAPGAASIRCGGPGRPQGHRLGVSHGSVLRCPCGVLRGGGQDAGGEGRAGGGDEIESQTLRGVVSRAHTFLYRLAAGFP